MIERKTNGGEYNCRSAAPTTSQQSGEQQAAPQKLLRQNQEGKEQDQFVTDEDVRHRGHLQFWWRSSAHLSDPAKTREGKTETDGSSPQKGAPEAVMCDEQISPLAKTHPPPENEGDRPCNVKCQRSPFLDWREMPCQSGQPDGSDEKSRLVQAIAMSSTLNVCRLIQHGRFSFPILLTPTKQRSPQLTDLRAHWRGIRQHRTPNAGAELLVKLALFGREGFGYVQPHN